MALALGDYWGQSTILRMKESETIPLSIQDPRTDRSLKVSGSILRVCRELTQRRPCGNILPQSTEVAVDHVKVVRF